MMTEERTNKLCLIWKLFHPRRREILKDLNVDDYSEGPLEEKMHGILPMWVFGKMVKQKEVYIKVSMGTENRQVICISFHISEHQINYPFK